MTNVLGQQLSRISHFRYFRGLQGDVRTVDRGRSEPRRSQRVDLSRSLLSCFVPIRRWIEADHRLAVRHWLLWRAKHRHHDEIDIPLSSLLQASFGGFLEG